MACSTAVLKFSLLIFVIFCVKKTSIAASNSVCYTFDYGDVVDCNCSLVYSTLWNYSVSKISNTRNTSKLSAILLLLLSGDIETCPGPVVESIERTNEELEILLQQRGLRIFHQNTRSLWSNFAHVSELLTSFSGLDILTLSETHIGDETCNLYNVEGYTFESRPRKAGKGVGVAVYIRKGIVWSRRYDLEIDEIEGIWIEIFLPRSKPFLICILYRPPDVSDYLHNNFTNLLNLMICLLTLVMIQKKS